LESGCGDRPTPGNLDATAPLAAIANTLQPKTVCFIHHLNTSASTPYIGPDGRAVGMTPAQCQQANADAQIAEQQAQQQAQQQHAEDAQRAAQERQAEQQKRAPAEAQALRKEEARGYKPVTLKDLLLDARAYSSANAVKVSISGFYKLNGRHDERLYASYNDFMMHTYQSVEATYVGLITDRGSRAMREYLMRCGATIGCPVTILGHVSPCVETNAFGAATGDFCLVAEDMRPSEN
jgi:hypothetical protein